jgi:hypothetical protein
MFPTLDFISNCWCNLCSTNYFSLPFFFVITFEAVQLYVLFVYRSGPKVNMGLKAEIHQHLAHKRAMPLCRCSAADTNHISEECFGHERWLRDSVTKAKYAIIAGPSILCCTWLIIWEIFDLHGASVLHFTSFLSYILYYIVLISSFPH